MTFRFYITDLCDGTVYGTHSQASAESLAACEDNFVVDAQTGEWITSDISRQPIQEYPHVSGN